MAELSGGNSEFSTQGQKALSRSNGYADPGKSQKVGLTTAAAFSAVLSANTHVRLVSDAACYVKVAATNQAGDNVDTTGKDMYLPANTPTLVYLGQAVDNTKFVYVSAATLTGTGNLYISPMLGL